MYQRTMLFDGKAYVRSADVATQAQSTSFVHRAQETWRQIQVDCSTTGRRLVPALRYGRRHSRFQTGPSDTWSSSFLDNANLLDF